MNRYEFKNLMDTLQNYFRFHDGLDAVLVEEYWKAVYFVQKEDIDKLRSDLVSSYRFFPKIAEIRHFSEKYRRHTKREYKNTQRCYYCMNSGVITYVKKGIEPYTDREYEFSSACPYCDAGKQFTSWPLASNVLMDGELDWLARKNRDKFGDQTPEAVVKAKHEVTTFIKGA